VQLVLSLVPLYLFISSQGGVEADLLFAKIALILIHHISPKAVPEHFPCAEGAHDRSELVSVCRGDIFQGGALVALPDLCARLAFLHRTGAHFLIVFVVCAGHRAFRLVLHCPAGLDRNVRL